MSDRNDLHVKPSSASSILPRPLTATSTIQNITMIPIKTPSQEPATHRQAVTAPVSSRLVPKPVPRAQHEDPRTYQINQLRKRYSAEEKTSENDGATSLVFKLAPSDPDFPYKLDLLECNLRIPESYPKEGSPPRLSVLNKDLPRGFAINVEKGWTKLVEENRGATLLALTNALDKHLEQFLSEGKADTIKITTYKDTRHIFSAAESASPSQSALPTASIESAPKLSAKSSHYVPDETFTKVQIAEAQARRAQETRQVESRMKSLPHYFKAMDGIVYNLPLEPRRRSDLPLGLQGVNSMQLIVPILYPLQPMRILLNDVKSEDAEDLEDFFTEHARKKKELSIMSHLNNLTSNLHILAKQSREWKNSLQAEAREAEKIAGTVATESDAATISKSADIGHNSHVRIIPRPPEWDADFNDESSGEESYVLTDLEDDNGGGVLTPAEILPVAKSAYPPPAVERGTAMSFPSIELRGIELLQVSNLSINVKCDRCKTINNIIGIQPNASMTSSCRKCATPFTITFSPELVHARASRAGFIDATGCTVSDMLASQFIPTCARCSTPSVQGLVSVRGDTLTNVCRECHARFSFKILEVKFLVYTPVNRVQPPSAGPRHKQEKLGLHPGEPLPDKGTCKHYRNSHRWFRFSCCSKVYACDRCHDEGESHVNEWANRMICGFCSREQNYAVSSCGFCGRSVVGRRGRGFWEGGKGTRDRKLMSRKDPRKYKRAGGTEVKKC